LPDTASMPNRVLLQKGHCISFGTPVTQMIRLSGAEVVEVGVANACRGWHVRHELGRGNVAAIFAVESYHTSMYDGVPLPELAEIAHESGVPLIVDGATQELRLRELVATGADAVVCSAHKYLGSTTAGVVAGHRDLIDGILLQNQGIGRGMKVGKEGIFGVIAAFEAPLWRKRQAWTAEENSKVRRVVDALASAPGVRAAPDPDPNGCPFLRVRIELDDTSPHTSTSLREALASGEPSIVVRCYGFERDSVYINCTEMTDSEVESLCDRLRHVLTA